MDEDPVEYEVLGTPFFGMQLPPPDSWLFCFFNCLSLSVLLFLLLFILLYASKTLACAVISTVEHCSGVEFLTLRPAR